MLATSPTGRYTLCGMIGASPEAADRQVGLAARVAATSGRLDLTHYQQFIAASDNGAYGLVESQFKAMWEEQGRERQL